MPGADGTTREIACKALVLTTGLAWQRLPAECIEQFEGRGVYYGVGDHRSARTAAARRSTSSAPATPPARRRCYLAEYARRVVMVVRGTNLGEKMSQYLVDRIEGNTDEIGKKIDVLYQTEVVALPRQRAPRRADAAEPRDRRDDGGATRASSSSSSARRRAPDWLGDLVHLDAHGFVLTGPDLDPAEHLKDWPLERAPYLLEASVPGVFAAGDVRHESVKRVASAVGEGSVAVHFIHRYLASL